MKFALALLALVATASVEAAPNGDLAREIQDFIDLIPVDQIVSITIRYMSEDEQFQQMIEFLQSDEFKELVINVEKDTEIVKMMAYMYNAGFDIYYYLNYLNDWLGIPPVSPPKDRLLSNYKTGGIRGYLDEVEAILPTDKLEALFNEKMQNSKVWRDFINQLKSKEFNDLVQKVYRQPTVQKMLEMARQVGVDLKRVAEIIEKMLGIHFDPKH